MKLFLRIRLYCGRIINGFIRNYLQQGVPQQYLLGKKDQDIAYTDSHFFERSNKKEGR